MARPKKSQNMSGLERIEAVKAVNQKYAESRTVAEAERVAELAKVAVPAFNSSKLKYNASFDVNQSVGLNSPRVSMHGGYVIGLDELPEFIEWLQNLL